MSRHKRISKPTLVYCDKKGNVFDYPGYEPVFRTGKDYVRIDEKELIKLPFGSVIFSMPGRSPVFYNNKNDTFDKLKSGKSDIRAASAFISSGYLRTFLPGFVRNKRAPVLPLWAYSGIVLCDDDFYVPALRIDKDPRSDYEIHQNDEELKVKIDELKIFYPSNNLIGQLAKCASEYNCLCARNFFISRFEAPVPTSPVCNSGCVGCLSFQEDEAGFLPSQDRLDFKPSPDEISQVILHHFKNVPDGVASFGQGCEGEPLLRGEDLVTSIKLVRDKTSAGTININTNGSHMNIVRRMISAGLDSIRVSLNSPTEIYYLKYHRPVNYSFADVLRTIGLSIEAGIFVSVNLFFMPGFTDMESEIESLFRFLDKYPVNMIQTRNLNIDPDYYFDSIDYKSSKITGIRNLVKMLRERYPQMKLGYYNPPKEKF